MGRGGYSADVSFTNPHGQIDEEKTEGRMLESGLQSFRLLPG